MRKPDIRFTSDGCSGGMSFMWKQTFDEAPPWEDICKDHDRDYWRGGTHRQRYTSDRKLLIKMIWRGYIILGLLMFIAVRLGGSPYFPFSFRWGYGHSDRKYVRKMYWKVRKTKK